jgi:hypothetical protein
MLVVLCRGGLDFHVRKCSYMCLGSVCNSKREGVFLDFQLCRPEICLWTDPQLIPHLLRHGLRWLFTRSTTVILMQDCYFMNWGHILIYMYIYMYKYIFSCVCIFTCICVCVRKLVRICRSILNYFCNHFKILSPPKCSLTCK